MFLIKYFDSLSIKNNNIVIFITKLSDLNTISLPFNISVNLGHKQNTKTPKVNLTLPEILLSMNKI